MMLRIGVEQPPDHALVLGMVPSRFSLEKLDALLAQSKRDLHSLVPKNKVFRARQKVGNDLKASEWFIRVFDFPAHRLPYPFASSQPQRSG